MKSEIISRLGHTGVLLPSLIAEDRVKARLSVLQAESAMRAIPPGFDSTWQPSAVLPGSIRRQWKHWSTGLLRPPTNA
jgi:hypothetical protein